MDTVEQLIVDNKVTVVTKTKKRAIVSRKIVSNTEWPKVVRSNKATKAVKSGGCNSCAARKMARLQNAQNVQIVQSVQPKQ